MEFTKRNYNSCMNVNERVSVRVVIVLNEIRNGSPRAKKGELNVAIEKKRAATVAVAISKWEQRNYMEKQIFICVLFILLA